jgi:transcriptional regulator with PAS, ATPase and Fis domain
VKGAFTGAVRDTPGHVQLAEGGTLFLDEVAEVPLELQAKLLRVLETRTVLPVGAREPIPVDVRIISATHRSLRREVELGRFRADLMFRLRVIPVFLPALRERIDDVSLLVDRFIGELNGHRRREVEGVSPAALAALEAHDWPGNVRELRNVIEYAFVVGDGPIIERTDLPPELLEREGEGDVAPTIVEATSPAPVPSADGPEAEVRRIRQALERTRGHKEQAARLLGISRITLWRRMKELGLAR